MKRIKSSKSALISAILALVMTVTMLVGTTFAWFTDSVTSKNNVIKAGNLDVMVEYLAEDGTWVEMKEDSNVFKEDTLWEPGHTEVVYLKVNNRGSLAFKYKLGVNIVSETIGVNVAGDSFLLSDYIYFATKDMTTFEEFATRNDAMAITSNSKLISEGFTKIGEIDANGAPDYIAMVVYMPESVGNEANYRGSVIPEIQLGIDVFATQNTVENDSFGSDYDAGAELPKDPIVDVKGVDGSKRSYDSLNKAFAEITDGDTAILRDNVTVDETVVYNKDVAATFDLAGYTVSGALDTLIKLTAGNLTVKNGSIANVLDETTETKYAIAMTDSAVATVTDVNITATGTGIYLTDSVRIVELNANIDATLVTLVGTCAFDAVCLDGDARIDVISGGTYKSRYADGFIEAWEAAGRNSSVTMSHPVQMISSGTSIGEIKGGEFLGIMDKGNRGTAICVNCGTIQKISGGYFGFYEKGQTATYPDTCMYVNTANGASIGEVVGGKFVKGRFRDGFNAGFLSCISGEYELVATGETVTITSYFSTGEKTNILDVMEIRKI